MFGAIVGDIAGSCYERLPSLEGKVARLESKRFDLFPSGARFTDDTVLTVAVAEALMLGTDYASRFRKYARMEPKRGYGHRFGEWVIQARNEGDSFGNGSAMRVSPVAWFHDSLEDVEIEAERSAISTHGHPEGVKGAVIVAGCVFLARMKAGKNAIKDYAESQGYDVGRSVDEIRDSGYGFDSTCQGSVPEAISAFLESRDYEDAIRNAIYLSGDADTQAAIAGSIAEAFYGIPPELKLKALEFLTPAVTPMAIEFDERFVQGKS